MANGHRDALIPSLGRLSEKLAILDAHALGDSIAVRSARIGPALIFQRLRQTWSIDKVLTALLKTPRFEFPVERAIFLTVLDRFFSPGSDRAAGEWKDDYAIEGPGCLDLHLLYGAMAWLGEVLLALPLRKELQERLARKEGKLEWGEHPDGTPVANLQIVKAK